MDIMLRDSSDARPSIRVELSVDLLREAIIGGTQDNIEHCIQVRDATRERTNLILKSATLGQEKRASLGEGLKRLELALHEVNYCKRARSAHNE